MERDEFREGVFKRDYYFCVVCKQPGVDAHHIIERRLFIDGGYDLDNGATLCEPCHILAESTELHCDVIREYAGIKKIILPEHLYPDVSYDKWGNPFMENGMRMRGELFFDESVQKVLAPVLHLFTNRVRFPRTWHLPWSPGRTKDDRILKADPFIGMEVVVTEKMDGENTTLYSDYMHARSVDYTPEVWRDRVKSLWANICGDIPEGYRICGENLVAKHSIRYTDLPSFFLLFSVWNRKNECLSWKDTEEWALLLGLNTVPILWKGIWNYDEKINFIDDYTKREGYVIRPVASFHYRDYSKLVGKYVREQHIQTGDSHIWKRRLEYNEFR